MQRVSSLFAIAGKRGFRRAGSLVGYAAALGLLFTAAGMDGASCDPGTGPDPNDPVPTLTAIDHVLGDANAPVIVFEYADFECPFCGRFARETFPTLKTNYIDTGKVRWVFRHFPLSNQCNSALSSDLHTRACKAAEASECANDQGQFFAYHDNVFEHQDDCATVADCLTVAKLKDYAVNVGLNETTFNTCVDGTDKAVRVGTDVSSGIDLGVSSTPTFWVNDEKVVGFKTAAQMSQIIDSHLP